MSNKGIDYGLGQSNIDTETGIRYGVISQGSINPDCMEDFEHFYGEPTCPECGEPCAEVTSAMRDWEQSSKHGRADYACKTCKHTLDSFDVFSEESLGFSYDAGGYKLHDCLDSDIFVTGSPYFTFAQFCSPCVPGAGNLDNPMPDGIKTYCLGHDFFEDGTAPYPVYDVQTGEPVNPE